MLLDFLLFFQIGTFLTLALIALAVTFSNKKYDNSGLLNKPIIFMGIWASLLYIFYSTIVKIIMGFLKKLFSFFTHKPKKPNPKYFGSSFKDIKNWWESIDE
jgi:predicted membrane protein